MMVSAGPTLSPHYLFLSVNDEERRANRIVLPDVLISGFHMMKKTEAIRKRPECLKYE